MMSLLQCLDFTNTLWGSEHLHSISPTCLHMYSQEKESFQTNICLCIVIDIVIQEDPLFRACLGAIVSVTINVAYNIIMDRCLFAYT